MPVRTRCELLEKLKQEIVCTFQEARKIRRSKDLSFSEDAELTRSEHRKIDALVTHLLSGHAGKPCPAGDRPIISGPKRTESFRNNPAA
jgi:hypothetical protein